MTSGYPKGAPDLPSELIESAIALANEAAWPADLALDVIDYLADIGHAVVGVEQWEAVGDSPKWLASSDYRCNESENTVRYIECCAAGARQFVKRWQREPGSLFNMTWSRPS